MSEMSQNRSISLVCSSLLLFSIFNILGCIGGAPGFEPIDQLLRGQIPDSLMKEHAVIILEEDIVEITGNQATVEYKLVKKILKSGHPEEGAFEFPKNRFSEVLSLQAKAVYPDGSEKIISLKDLEPIPAFGRDVLYEEAQKYIFTIPGLSPGTVIQLRVKCKVKNLVFLPRVLFQGENPIVTRRFVLIHPERMNLRVHASNMPEAPDNVTLEGKLKKLIWERHNIEPFKFEEMMPPPQEYLPYLEFSFGQKLWLGCALKQDSWRDIVSWFDELSRKSFEAGPSIKALVRELCPSGMSDIEKARILFSLIEQKLRYVAISLGLDGYRPHQAEEIWSKLYGDCKDQSAVLISALREAGLRAVPVLVRTTDVGRPESVHPTPTYFNHMITAVMMDTDTLFLDPTCDDCGFRILTSIDQGADALIIADGSNKLIRLPVARPQPNKSEVKADIAIDGNGSAKITMVMDLYGIHSTQVRRILAYTGGKTKEQVIKYWLLRNLLDIKFDRFNIDGIDPAADKIIVSFACSVPSLVNTDKKFVSVPVMYYPIALRLPSDDDRRFPVDIGSLFPSEEEYYECIIRMPEGWSVTAASDPFVEENRYFRYRSSWEREEGSIRFSREWAMKKTLIPPTQLKTIREKLKSAITSEYAEVLFNRPGD